MSEKIIYLGPEEEMTDVRERLENTQARRIILVIPPQTQMRSHVSWRQLRARVRELGQDVLIISSDRQIRTVAKAAGFQVAESLESSPSGSSRPLNRPVRRDTDGKSYQRANKQASSGKKVTRSLPSGQQQMSQQTNDNSSKLSSSSDMNGEFDSAAESSFGIEDDPLGYIEDIQPTALPEQRASTVIHDFDQGVPDISDVPTDVYDAEVEDLGDVGGGMLQDDWPSHTSDDQMLKESEVQETPRMYRMPPRSSRTRNTIQPSLEDLGNEDDLLPPSSQIEDHPTRVTPSSPARSSGSSTPSSAQRYQPQPLRPARNVSINPTQQTKKPVTAKKSRVVTPPPSSGSKPMIPPRPSDGNRRGGIGGSTSRRLFITLLVILSILLILFMVVGFAMSNNILPSVVYSTTATITTASRDLKNTYEITGVVGIPDASHRQIQVRLLSNTTTSQAKTILVSGVGHIPATVARGSLTFYNALPYSQVVVAGTVFIDNNGVQVVNDKPAIIPASRPPVEGSVTIPAHSITIGTKGNIPAFAFNDVSCCIVGITVLNHAAFSGGKDQRNYTFVQQSDIDGIVNAEKASLIQHTESELHAGFFQNEQFINPDKCTSDSISDHVAGDRAPSVTVALTVTCAVEVFDRQAAQLMVANLLTNQAIFDLGASYTLVGKIVTTIKHIEIKDVDKGTIILLVGAEGIWAYQFSDSSKKMLAEFIAGKNSTDAQSLLIHHVGIANANIQVSGIFVNMLPDDPRRINIVIQSVHGL